MRSPHAPDPEYPALVQRSRSGPERADPLEPIAAPFAGAVNVDLEGRSWRLRGKGQLARKRMLGLLHDPAVTVLHQYLWDPVREIKPAEREAFWAAAEAKMAASTFSVFAGAEYVDPDHHHLLFISESC